jgi:hypothetical protein
LPLAALLFAGLAIAGENPPPGGPPAANAFEVSQIRLEPSRIEFTSSREYRRVLVIGKSEKLGEVDLTRSATFSVSSDCVRVDAEGYLIPARDGEATVSVTAGGRKAELPVSVRGLGQASPVSFVRDVQPILNKVGCTSGLCHGAAKGKNGFKLSLRGYDPQFDYYALAHDLSGRRVNRVDPPRSLMLMKPTAQVAHGGGLRLDPDSRYYRTVLQWISEGVNFGDPQAGHIEKLEVLPAEILMRRPGLSHQLVVLAHYAGGGTREVTREAVFTSNTPSVVEASSDGNLSAQRNGEATILVRYEGNYAPVAVTVLSGKSGFQWVQLPQYNYVDKYVDQKLQRLEVLPAPLADDAEFLRRVSLDLTGLPPTAEKARAFLADPAPARLKRARYVDELMASPEFVDHWSLKWGDLLDSNRKFLGEKGLWRYREWIRRAVAENKPYDQLVRELLTARGSTYENPAANFFVVASQPKVAMETTTQLFLGVRMVCAQCHDHPFEQWTQKNYYELASFFARVGVKEGTEIQEKVVYESRDEGEVTHPKTGRVVAPRFPFAQPAHFSIEAGRRQALAEWLTSKNNPYFARAIANRIWSYFFGRGIIDPVDDIRTSNPPSNPALLEALTSDFVQHNFDLQHLMRTIVRSRTYQLSFRTNEWNQDDTVNFSRALPRRLSAEELMDAISLATGSRIHFKEVPKEFRAQELPDSKIGMGGFLDLFGRPQRESPCECERRNDLSLGQALNLINGATVADAIADPSGRVARLVLAGATDKVLIEDLYLASWNRSPNAAELDRAREYLAGGPNRAERAQNLLWAMLNSNAFLFNR